MGLFDIIQKETSCKEFKMTMKSNVLRDANGNIIIHMEGQIEYEYSIPFRDNLTQLATDNPNATITIDLAKVDFVGSSGICHFVETVKLINGNKANTLSLSNVKNEFIRVFKLYELDENEVFMEYFDMDNDDTYYLNNKHGNRGRTFEN